MNSLNTLNRSLNRVWPNVGSLSRALSLSSVDCAKKVVVSNDESKTVIEGIPVDLGRKEKLLDTKKMNKNECCAICALDLKPNYTDVLILSQYLNEDNKIVSFPKSQLCGRKYFLMQILIQQAQKCNLLPKPKDHVKYGPWEDLEHYVDYLNRRRDDPMKIIRPYYA